MGDVLRKFLDLLRSPDADLHEVRNAAQQLVPLAESDGFPDTQPLPGAADDYPLSRSATPVQVAAAGIRNGMSPAEVESCLARHIAASR